MASRRVSIWAAVLWVGLCAAGSAQAQDRFGFFGQSFTVPYKLTPSSGRGYEVYGIDFGYFFTERWLAVLSGEFALRGPERVNIAIGPRCLFRLHSVFKPYVGGEFLYLIDPTNDLGWRAYIGAEWDMVRLTGLDNLRLSFQTGMSGIAHLSHTDELFYEILRVSLGWSY